LDGIEKDDLDRAVPIAFIRMTTRRLFSFS
jgi:hypothetical protein